MLLRTFYTLIPIYFVYLLILLTLKLFIKRYITPKNLLIRYLKINNKCKYYTDSYVKTTTKVNNFILYDSYNIILNTFISKLKIYINFYEDLLKKKIFF